jgi:hypothetical protein
MSPDALLVVSVMRFPSSNHEPLAVPYVPQHPLSAASKLPSDRKTNPTPSFM